MANYCSNLKIIFSLFCFIFCALKISGEQSNFSFEYITNDNGLTHNTVYDICQDDKGFIWFATEVGLNRFDGRNIKQYRHNPLNLQTLPSYTVTSLVYTSDNIFFVGTTNGLAVYNAETDNFTHLVHAGKSLGHISLMREGFDSELLIATENNGAFIYNYNKRTLSRFQTEDQLHGIIQDDSTFYWAFSRSNLYKFNGKLEQIAIYPFTPPQTFASAISYIWFDENKKLWLGTFENGVYLFDENSHQFNQLPVCQHAKIYYIRTIASGNNPNEYWIGAESGLYIVNIGTNTFKHFTQSFDKQSRTINDNAIYKIFHLKDGIHFLGTYFGGVNIVKTQSIGFNALLPGNHPNDLQGKAISVISKANDGNLWIATEDAGIAIYNPEKFSFRHLKFDSQNSQTISSNNVHALLMDGNTCWAGHFMGGISKIDIKTGKAKRFIQNPNKPNSLSDNFVFALHFLSSDTILVGTTSGVDIFDTEAESFSKFRENEFAGSFVYDIFTAPDGKIWFCTYNNGIFVLDQSKIGLMTHYKESDDSGLASNSVISYCVDSAKQIWIGTRNGGLMKFNSEKECFTPCKPSMLNDNIVYGIVEDDDGFFWISTNKGISRLNFRDSTSIHFNVKHGIAGNQYNYKSYYKDDKIIYFGSVTGLTWFNPQTIVTPQIPPKLYFSDLRIFNEVVFPDSTGILKKQIDFTEHLRFKHNQNSFSLDFASINYSSADIAYQYYLEGLEDTWSPLATKSQANYTNIAPGEYLFRLRAVNMINGALSEERVLLITVDPPFWKTWYAYLVYGLILFGIAFYFYRTYKNRQKEQMALAIEKIENENLKLLHQHKMNFFTYITHEFKTPLSIITASVEMLSKQSEKKDEEAHQTITRSANRLLTLINQLMEFRKIETDHAVIHQTKGNIVDFTNQIIETYRPLFEKKNIVPEIKVSYIQAEVFFDFDKLEQIITNLLTNAIKYTPHNGKIRTVFLVDNNTIQISVRDSGAGVSKRKADKIFEVFYSEGFSDDVVESSGIGLALTASLVKLLGGEITVDSQPGKGSEFKVTLPYKSNAAGISVVETDPLEGNYTMHESVLNVVHKSDILILEEEPSAKEYTLVIAEDNKDLLLLLQKHFKDKFHVKCFENGKETWDYINLKTPDILITDIMMPVMSGIELCRKIKTDIDLCHIPVIMLTAKDTKEAKLEGLTAGADAYVTKPFLLAELELRLNNILNNHKALKVRLKDIARFEGLDLPQTNHEQAFIEKLLTIVQDNIENENLDVQFITDILHISRSNLHNKVKSLINMNTSEFINMVKINKAKELISQSPDYTFMEIAYKVGYKDSAYFTRVFKKHTGQTPKAYKSSVFSK